MNGMSLSRRGLMQSLAAGCALAALAPVAASAAAYEFKFYGFTNQNLRGGPLLIPSYQITFFTSHQSTAVADVAVRSRLTSTITGVGESKMRALTEEAYADFRAQLEAAGIAVAPQDQLKAAMIESGVPYAANNHEIKPIKAGITIGKSVKKAYAAFGAADAPLIEGLHQATPGGMGMGIMARMGMVGKTSAVAKSMNGVVVMPCLVLDFAKSEAKTGNDFMGRKKASASSDIAFGIASTSNVALNTAMNNGRATTPGGITIAKDYWVDTPFATVAEGEAAVRALSVTSVTDQFYIDQDTARGDAVEIDVAVWEGLVRDAYKAFNAQVVAEFKKARG